MPPRQKSTRQAAQGANEPGAYTGASKLPAKNAKNATGGSNNNPQGQGKSKGKGKGKATAAEPEEPVENSKRSSSARLQMFARDRNAFSKIKAAKDKIDKIAASARADAEADPDPEEPVSENEPAQRSRNASPKKAAPKKSGWGKSATKTPVSPTVQEGKITKTAKGNQPEKKVRRPHRKKEYFYETAPSDSEWEEKRKAEPNVSGHKLNLAKLKESVDRHARWCPFVRIHKKLQHAHRRIRDLQARQEDDDVEMDESEADDPESDDGGANEVDNGNDKASDRAQEEDSDGEDDDDNEQAGAVDDPKAAVPQKKNDAPKSKATTVKGSARTNNASAMPADNEQPAEVVDGHLPPQPDQGKPSDNLALPGGKRIYVPAPRKIKRYRLPDFLAKFPDTPWVHCGGDWAGWYTFKYSIEQPRDSSASGSEIEPEGANVEEASSDIEEDANETGNATAGAADTDAPTGKATKSKDEALKKVSLHRQSSGSEIEVAVKGEVDRERSNSAKPRSKLEESIDNLQPLRPDHAVQTVSTNVIGVTKGGDAKKRKASVAALASETEPTGKNRRH